MIDMRGLLKDTKPRLPPPHGIATSLSLVDLHRMRFASVVSSTSTGSDAYGDDIAILSDVDEPMTAPVESTVSDDEVALGLVPNATESDSEGEEGEEDAETNSVYGSIIADAEMSDSVSDKANANSDSETSVSPPRLLPSQASTPSASVEPAPRMKKSPRKTARDKIAKTVRSFRKMSLAILDPERRVELRETWFGDFIRPQDRLEYHVPKNRSKTYFKERARKFIDLFQKYKRLIKENPEQEDLLMAFECLLGDLMDCIDHPKELRDYNPFAAFADFVDAGAVIRSPECVQSASRLTLGATWSLLSPEDEKRIGYPLMLRLTRLHWYRRAAIDDILHRWSDGKFCKDSTCRACFVDPWELFLLSIPLAIVKEGTRYLDFETASDTSSSEGESDNDTDNDNDMDDHNGADEDSEAGEEVETFPPDMLTPFRQHIHPHNLVPMHPSLENYGPNAYILRVVSMDMIGFEAVPNHKKARCFACGFRFDGQEPSKLSKVWKDLSKAVETARRQIRAVPETI